MKKTRLLSVVAVLISIVMVFTACGSSSSSSSATTATATAAATAAATTAAAPAETGLKGDLVYWSWWNDSENNAKVINEAIAEFQTANPGVKITVQYNGREISKVLKPALDAGQKIDMFDTADAGVADYAAYLLKLDDYYAKAYPSTNGKTLNDSLIPGFIATMKGRAADKTSLYGIPYQPYVFANFYNKTLFEKAGITATPKTWTEFIDVCAKLKAAGIVPTTIDDAYMSILRTYMFDRMLGEEGSMKLSTDATAWDDPKVLQVAKLVEDFAAAGYFSKQVKTNKFPAGQQEFATGGAAIYPANGTWFPNEVAKTTGPDFKWGCFAFPSLDGGANGAEAGMYGSMGFFINKSCDAPEAAFTFFASMVTGKWDTTLAERATNCPISLEGKAPAALAESGPIFAGLSQCWQTAGLDKNADKGAIISSNFTKLATGVIKAQQFVDNCKNNKK